jgi:hypothetical protein
MRKSPAGWMSPLSARDGVGSCLVWGGSLVVVSVRIDTMAFADTVMRRSMDSWPLDLAHM